MSIIFRLKLEQRAAFPPFILGTSYIRALENDAEQVSVTSKYLTTLFVSSFFFFRLLLPRGLGWHLVPVDGEALHHHHGQQDEQQGGVCPE